MSPWLRCTSPTGWDWYLASAAVLAIEPANYEGYCFVSLRLPRSEVSRVLVCEPRDVVLQKYFDLNPVCDWPRVRPIG